MPDAARDILQHLQSVFDERALRQRDGALQEKVHALKRYQQQRFCNTYADLLAMPRYAGAARFFLDELYGPEDFSTRDEQFARIVPAMVKLFPDGVVDTVRLLAALHALSERLDTAMASALPSAQIRPADYVHAWQATGARTERAQQIDLMLEIGQALEHYTRKPMWATTLRMMRGPAKAAGLLDLQRFLEAGLDSFKAMRGAREFLHTIASRERALVERLFSPGAVATATAPSRPSDDPLVQLP
jgi:hypothetical protein